MPVHFERTQGGSWFPSVTALFALIAAAVAFLWFVSDEPQVTAASRAIQTATGDIRAIKDGLANQRRDIKVLFDQFSALTARLSVLQEDTTTILRNTAELAEQVRATQTQMAQDNAKAVEQLKAVAQQARDHASAIAQTKDGHEQVDGVANGSEESPEFRPPLPRPRPALAIAAKRKLVRQSQIKLLQ